MSFHRSKNTENKAMLHLLTAIVVLLNVQSNNANQNPFRDPSICGRPQCETTLRKFNFRDNLYKYEYSVDLNTEFSGTGNNASNLFLKAAVNIFFPKPCDGFLLIRDVKLWDHKDLQKDNELSINAHRNSQNSDEDDYYGDFTDSSDSEPIDDFTNIHPKSLELANDLKKYSLRFSFNDGLISEICPNFQESIWALNFKKGILSTFQNTMMRFDVDFNTTEVDTSGECNVKYTLEDVNNVFIKIRKSKNMSTCRKRYSTNSILQSTPYSFRDDKAIWPIIHSTSYCDMIINNNMYEEIICREQHQLIIFSNNHTGAITKVESRLVLQGEENYNRGDFLNEHDKIVERRSTLLFDHTPSTKPTHTDIKLARDLLKEICFLGFPYIKRDFLNVFTNFLYTIKQLDYEALTQLLARSSSICEKGKSHVIDALPYIGSSASYQLMRDQLLTNNLSKKVALSWLKSLSFIQRPDEDTIETIYTLLEFSRIKDEPEYTLCTTAVIRSYCLYNTDCKQNLRVKLITNSLETEFVKSYNSFRGERRLYERLIIIMKGLGNIGVLSEQFIAQLQKIIFDENALMDLRLESVYIFRRADCVSYRQFFLNIYTNFKVNSEIRMASYLQVMICPDYHAIKKIKHTLKIEEINQVGSFVWSHLKNLAKSSSPLNIAVQSLLLDDDISNKYELDMRKFSRNYQQNLFFDEFNFGSTIDLNVIFGTESSLPRMMTFNFTSNLFGHSINFLELTTRSEGFDELISSFIIPEDWFNAESILKHKGLKDILDIFRTWIGSLRKDNSDRGTNNSIKSNFHLINQRSQKERMLKNSTLRNDFCGNTECLRKQSNSINDVINYRRDLQKGIENMGYKLKYDYNNPKVKFGMRIFGNDLHYYSLNGIPEFAKLAKEFNIFEKISEILSGKEITYTKSNIFLEASHIAPLMIGVPLSIDLFGASSIDLRISGNINQLTPTASEWNFDIKGMFKPTLLVDLVGTMKSDMFYAQSGIKVKSTFYSNMDVEADLTVHGKNLVSFSFSLPQNTSEVLSVQSELIKMTHSKDEPQTGVESRRSNSTCTWSLLETTFGLKMCIDYSVPNLNNSKQALYPELILSGPLNFSVVLSKSDPTTKKWTFELTSNKQENNSKWAFIFHTPGSSYERSILANVSTFPESFNSSVVFTHGLNKAAVICQYVGGTNYKRFEFLLHMNNARSLDLNMELQRLQERNVWIYKPKMLLAVNGVNITGALGTMRINDKNGITQSDIDFSFETRKLQMLMRGVLMQSEVTKSANISVNYRFQTNKIESIYLEGRLVNSGDKSKVEYNGNLKLRASAHPKLNFASNATWRSLQGHTEGILTYNNAKDLKDPNSTSIWHLILSRSYSEDNIWEGSRSYVSFNVKIPRSKVNFKLYLKHEERYKNGTEHNVLAEIHLSPEKEALVLFSVSIPQRELLTFDTSFNVSVSKFNSCSGRLKFIENSPKTYMINVNGVWFTEDYIIIKANYKDRNHRLQALKMIIESGSFEITTLNAVYRRTQTFIYSNFNLKYGDDPYNFAMQLNSQPDEVKPTICEVHINLKEKKYWLNSSLVVKHPQMWQVEIHLDKLRDICIKSSALYLDKQKEVSFEINWDMNRDPSRRLLLLADYKIPSMSARNGQIVVTYPDRTITCRFKAHSQLSEYYGEVYTSWDINEAIILKYSLGLMSEQKKSNWLRAEVHTPFNGWNVNSFDANLYSFGSLVLANTSLMWGGNEYIELFYKYDVNFLEILKSIDIIFGVNSSLVEVPSLNLKINHLHDLSKIHTNLSLRYNNVNETIKTYCWNSKWELRKSLHYENISGTIFILSPHKEFWKGGLVTKLSLNNNRNLIGAASITYNLKEISLTLNGYVNKFNDNMISINITTPLNELRNIRGRFGIIEKKRNVVAEIRTPSTTFGFEILLDILSLADFDVKFSIATPIDDLKHAALYAKLKKDAMDMRGIWNNVTVGVTGVSYMNDYTDFEYSCKIYTPFKDFEENGFIVKFLKKDLFALYIHSRFSRYVCGIEINGKPKSFVLKELGNEIVNLEARFDKDFNPPKIDQKEYSNIEDFEYEEFFSYNMDFIADLLFWPTIEGIMDIEEVLDYYFITTNIKLPQGYVDIKNNLYFPDYLNLINVLSLETPFESMEKVKLITEHKVDIDFRQLHEKLYCIHTAGNLSNEVGFEVNYDDITDAIKPHEHNLNINLALPSKNYVKITGNMHLDESMFKGNLTTTAGNTCILLTTAIVTEENFLEASIDFSLEESKSIQYKGVGYFKQDFSIEDNTFDIKIEIMNQTDMIMFQIESTWQSENGSDEITSNGKFINTLLPFKLFEYTFLLNKGPKPQLNFDLALSNQNGNNLNFGMRAIKKDEIINAELWTPMQRFKNISIHGTVTPVYPNQYQIEGVLYRDMVTYKINGMVQMEGQLPSKTRLQTLSLDNNSEGLIELNLLKRKENANDLSFQLNVIENGKRCKISGNYSYQNQTGLELSAFIESTEAIIERIFIQTILQYPENDCITAKLNLESPWHDMGLERIQLWFDIKRRLDNGKIRGGYQSGCHRGYGNCEWTWQPKEDMRLLIESNIQQPSANTSHLFSEIKYINPNKTFNNLIVSGKLNLNSIWYLEVNGNLNFESINDIGFGLLTHWPMAVNGVHDISGRYRGNIASHKGKGLDVTIEGKYFAKLTNMSCITRLSYKNLTDLHSVGNFEWGIVGSTKLVQADFQMLRKEKTHREFLATVITPKFENGATVYFMGSYNRVKGSYHNLNLSLNYPYTRRVANMDISLQSIENLNGQVNFTTPFLKAPWLNTFFNLSTNGGYCQGFCRVDWPTDFLFLKLHNLRTQHDLSNIFEGNVALEVPLTTRHLAGIKYRLIQNPQNENGILNIFYNEKNVLNGTYKRSEQNLTRFKEITEIFLENDVKPIGIHFSNSSGWRKENGFLNIKRLEIFDLRNSKKSNVTCELHEFTSGNDKKTKLLAIHPNRTIILTTNSAKSSKYKINHQSKLELSKTAWIGYNLVIGNKDEKSRRQFLAELSYPTRNLVVNGSYLTTINSLNSNVSFAWSGDDNRGNKVVHTRLMWQSDSLGLDDRDNQTLTLNIGHDLLETDLTITANFYRGIKDLIKFKMFVIYSHDLDHLIEITTALTDLSYDAGSTKYILQFIAYHKASELDVKFNASATKRPYYLKIETNSFYTRDYFAKKIGRFLVFVDLNNKEVEYMRKSPYRTIRVWLQPHLNYPVYGLNVTLFNTPEEYTSGFVYVNIGDKYTEMYFNLTEDGSQNLRMFGNVPNSRYAYVDIWRNYEDLSIVDVTTYIKLNHSRQISGCLHWRPQIKQELKGKMYTIKEAILNSITEHIDFWTKSLYVETLSAVSVVWETSKKYNKDFIEDLSQLSILEEDLEDLRLYLNNSYEANDFYMKSLVNYTLTILDEIALREHMNSLPAIFSEIRQILGESVKALRKSITQLIDMLKTMYDNIIQAVSTFFHGQPLKYLTTFMEKGFEKYENFVKEVHISFINHLETMWSNFSNIISTYLRGVLTKLEPHIFKAISYLEKIAWDLSKDIFNYINERTNELAESTYFNQVSSFTQDLENLYMDIKTHDAIANMKKYVGIAWKFIKEKYHKLIPFGSELNEIIQEIYQEIKELEKVKQVQIVLKKFKEVSAEVELFVEEIKLKAHIHNLYLLFRNKLRTYGSNALEIANMYREAKTKFAFDPEKGAIDFEQKLPISWHTFNETPKFKEIPEYKFITQLQNTLTTNTSILGHIYDLRSYLKVKTWFQPYYSRAYLIDSMFYITHDKRFVNLKSQYTNSSYILSHDFWNNTFTLTMDLTTITQDNIEIPMATINLLAKGHLFEINPKTDTLIIDGMSNPILPIAIEDLNVYRDSDILIMKCDAGFKIECNMKFNLCWLELSGRYFGQTAGLLGTMNNEPFDDFITPSNIIGESNDVFTEAWSINRCNKISINQSNDSSTEFAEICHQLFAPLSHCSSVMDVEPFLNICMDLGYMNRKNPKYSNLRGPCTAALAYIEICQNAKLPMRVPQQCVMCELNNGKFVPESTFVEYSINNESRSSDIVFLVESNVCNTFSLENQSIDSIVSALEEQLQSQRLIDTRYAVIAFGSQLPPFDYPRAISKNNDVFINSINILRQYLQHTTTFSKSSDGFIAKSDIMHAISTASRLNFRTGVSKIFIVVSSCQCDMTQMRFDYSSILQYMIDEGVALHILTNADFNFEKPRKIRHFFGFDKQFVYSNRSPEGNSEIRHTLRVSNSTIGVCVQLALETEGSVFIVKRKMPIKRLSTIFAKRVVQSAISNRNQTCECTGHNTGLAYMVCTTKKLSNKISNYEQNDSDFSDWDWDFEDYIVE
ncbi:apolipophorins [Zeugodacus cucurbitae]|uniref:apolipophorins n=1 Tax=Zeugodacus cucurbitae TaxID=28588 RepID=UPI0023D9376C|nr:apolipophorins [Zeugodacus cucurbitae]